MKPTFDDLVPTSSLMGYSNSIQRGIRWHFSSVLPTFGFLFLQLHQMVVLCLCCSFCLITFCPIKTVDELGILMMKWLSLICYRQAVGAVILEIPLETSNETTDNNPLIKSHN